MLMMLLLLVLFQDVTNVDDVAAVGFISGRY